MEVQRYGWCWDHSTNWTPAVHGRQTIGTNRSYLKRPEVFLRDGKALLDCLAGRGFSGLCMWGLIRDSHGGVAAAREIVEYGRQRGVAVTPGVGLFTYGGAYYEGEHAYNLETFALSRPECVASVAATWPEPLAFATGPGGARVPELTGPFLRRKRPWVQLCPSKPAVHVWLKEAVSWVIETLDLDMIFLEGGDVYTCQCDDCRTRRKRAVDARVSLEDLCAAYVPLVEYLHDAYPHVRIQCETYAAPGIVPAGSQAANGSFIPEDCVSILEAVPEPVQLELTYNCVLAEEQVGLPAGIARKALLRTEAGTQWRGPRSHCCAETVRSMMQVCRRLGIPAASLFVEEPESTPSHWINYEAFEAFSKADISLEDFVERRIAPYLGGVDRALEFARWASDPRCGVAADGIKFAREGGRRARDEEEFLKWAWLARFIAEHDQVDPALVLPTFPE